MLTTMHGQNHIKFIGVSFYHLHGLQVHKKQYVLFRSVFVVQSFCPKLLSLSVKR